MGIIDRFKLDNKIAIVTGGYGHIGHGLTMGLSEAGAKVVVCGRTKSKFSNIFTSYEQKNIQFEEMDISNTGSIKLAFKNIIDRFGRIDILVNNAVYSKGSNIEETSDEEWSYSIDGVLSSIFRCIREVVIYMKSQHQGNIINISSIYGMVCPDFSIYEGGARSYLNPPNYGAAKAGVIQITKYCAAYLAPYKIRVNCISPGPFPSTEIQKNVDFINKLTLKNPTGRIGHPEDLKAPLVFLASEASSFVVGHNLVVDGGWTIW